MKRTILPFLLLLLAATLSLADQASAVTGILQAGDQAASIAANPVTLNAYVLTEEITGGTAAPTVDPILAPPTITTSSATTFVAGIAKSFTVMTAGSPVPTLSYWGVLPTGLSFTDNGNGTATLAGTPALGTQGIYPIYITAANGVLPNAIQAFTLTVSEPSPTAPVITSINNATFTLGSFNSFTVTATGTPLPALSVIGTLPAGVTFTDNGNGVATLAGTPASGTQGNYPFIIMAANGVPPNAAQAFALKVKANPTIVVVPALSFNYTIGGLTPPAQTLGITSSGTELDYTVSTNQPWLSATPTSGTTPGSISAAVDPTGLAVGVYHGLVSIAAAGADNSPQTVAVTLTVSGGPILTGSPNLLSFTFTEGGSIPPSKFVGITSSGTELNYTVSSSDTWLLPTPSNGTTPSNIGIAVDPTGLAVGVHHGTVTITAAGATNSPQSVAVTLTVNAPAMLSVTPGTLNFSFTIGGSVPAAQNVNVTSSGPELNYTVSASDTWLSATPASGTSPSAVSVSIIPNGLSAGDYHGTVTITSPGATNSPQNVMVNLTVISHPQPPFVMGFDMRDTQQYIADVSPNTYVLGAKTLYPTTRGGATFGWTDSIVESSDRINIGDTRLAGINLVPNYIPPVAFQIDLPAPGTYSVSLAMGDRYYSQCWSGCRIEFKDGSTSLFVVSTGGYSGFIPGGSFMDANGQVWTNTEWPTHNTPRQVTVGGTTLTMLVGANNYGYASYTPIAFVGLASMSQIPDFSLSASPGSVTVARGGNGTSTVTTAVFGGFNGNVTLSTSPLPSGVTANFSPNPIAAPGGGSSTLTFTASDTATLGPVAVTVTATSGAITHTATVNLTVSSNQLQPFAIGFDMRDTQAYVSDTSSNTFVLGAKTLYPTTRNSVTFGWTSAIATSADRINLGDTRLAGINMVANDIAPGVFRVDLPAPGTYDISLALGDRYYDQCWSGCRVEFKDGNTTLFVVNPGHIVAGSFMDANGSVWTAAEWPAHNTAHQVTLSGSVLTVLVGANNQGYASFTPVAFIGVSK